MNAIANSYMLNGKSPQWQLLSSRPSLHSMEKLWKKSIHPPQSFTYSGMVKQTHVPGLADELSPE